MNYINKETRSYSELLHSSLFREATKEEREGIDNYIKSISKKLYTFTDEQLEEHDKQVRVDVIDEFKTDIINKIDFVEEWLFECKGNITDTNIAFSTVRRFAERRAEQLKENKE